MQRRFTSGGGPNEVVKTAEENRTNQMMKRLTNLNNVGLLKRCNSLEDILKDTSFTSAKN